MAARTSAENNPMEQKMEPKVPSPGDVFIKRSLTIMFRNSIANKEADKKRICSLLRQVSLDVLATEWLNLDQQTIESRAYLIGSVLPQVVLGLEHILREAVAKKLAGSNAQPTTIQSEGADPNFNPINRLAEFLMRNNHRYNNFCETSPYVRGLRNTVAKLQDEMFMRCNSQLAHLKAFVMKTREEKIRRQQEDEEECRYREACINDLFGKFLAPRKETIEAATVHDSIYAFLNLAVKVPETIRQILVPIFEKNTVEDKPKSYGRDEFITYVMLYAKPMNQDIFEIFLEHMELCAAEYRKTVEREKRTHLMTKFFVSCDLDQHGRMSRDRLRFLCERYFESAPKDMRELLKNPADWPVREYHLRVISPSPEPIADENNSNSGDLIGARENAAVDQNNSAALFPEELRLAETKVESEYSSSPGEKYAQPAGQSDTGHIVVPKQLWTGSKKNDEVLKVPESNAEIYSSENFNNCKEDSGLMLLDERTIINEIIALEDSTAYSGDSWSERQLHHGCDSESLTLPQFLQTMNHFIGDSASLSVVDQVVQFLECEFHKMSGADQSALSEMMKQSNSRQRLTVLTRQFFDLLNTECSGLVNYEKIEKHFQAFRDGYYLEALQKANEELIRKIWLARSHSPVRLKIPKISQSRNPSTKIGQELKVPESIQFGFPEVNSLLSSIFHVGHGGKCGKLPEEILDDLNELVASVPRLPVTGLEEQLRTETRQTWLKQIDRTIEQSTISAKLVYKSVFEAILKDNLQFGNRKNVSAHISMLQSSTDPKQNVLTCVAAVPQSEAQKILGLRLHSYETSLSFRVIRTGKPIHLAQLTRENVNDVHFWDAGKADTIRKEIKQLGTRKFASCLVLPIPNALHKIIGVLGIDTLTANSMQQPGFTANELEFYQGVTTRLGRGYSLISARHLFVQTVQSGFEWLSYHWQHLDRLVFYLCQDYEPNLNSGIEDSRFGFRTRRCVMRQIVTKNRSEPAILHQKSVGLKRTDNQFMKYLFTVADTSEPCDIIWLGTRHMVYPVRDLENVAFGLIDLYMRLDNTRENSSEWFNQNTVHANTMLSILNLVYRQLVIKTGLETMDRLVLHELESNVSNRLDIHEAKNTEEQVRADTVFEDLMLAELNQVQCLLIDEIPTGLPAFVNPPPIIIKLLNAFCSLTEINNAQSERTDNSDDHLHMVNKDWQDRIRSFDPTSARAARNLRKLDELFSDGIQKEVDQTQYRTGHLLYQWMRCCRTVSHIRSCMKEE